MHQSKMIRVLRKFTKQEFISLRKYLSSPTVKSKSGIGDSLLLFSKLEHAFPKFSKEKIDKDLIYKNMYPEEDFKKGKLEKQMTHLFALLEFYIMEGQKNSTQLLHDYLKLGLFYQEKGLTQLSKVTYKKYTKILSTANLSDTDMFRDVFLLEKQLSNHQAKVLNPKEPPNFLKVFTNLDHYYIAERLELTCRLVAINRFIFQVEFGDSMEIVEALRPLLEQDFFEPPLIKLYYRAFQLLTVDDVAAKQISLDFEHLLEKYEDEISTNHLIPLYAIIRNYCVSEYVKGDKGFLKRTFQIYKLHLAKGLLYQDNKIYTATLNNMVEVGLLMNEFTWVQQLIADHENRLTGSAHLEEEISLNWANYYFFKKEFEKAQDYLNVNFEMIYSKIKAKRIEVKVYYEMNHQILDSKIDAFKIFIYRMSSNKVTEKYKMGNRNFIDVLKQIQLPKTFKNIKRIDKLKAKVNSFTYIHEKDWLLEKLAALR